MGQAHKNRSQSGTFRKGRVKQPVDSGLVTARWILRKIHYHADDPTKNNGRSRQSHTQNATAAFQWGADLNLVQLPTWAGEKNVPRRQKPTLLAAREICLNMKEEKHCEELMGKPRVETRSVDTRLDKSKGRCEQSQCCYKNLAERGFDALDSANVPGGRCVLSRF